MMALHGLPKILGGPEGWSNLGAYGMPFFEKGVITMILGFLAAVIEFFGGIAVACGIFTKWASLGIVAVMAVAFTTHLKDITGPLTFAKDAGWSLELMIAFLAIFLASGKGKS